MARVRKTRLSRRRRYADEGIALHVLFALAVIWLFGVGIVLVWLPEPSNDNNNENAGSISGLDSLNKRVFPAIRSQQSNSYLKRFESPLLIFTCARAEYLERTLDNVYEHISNHCDMGCPIIISQDGENKEVTAVIQKFKVKFATSDIPLISMQHSTPPRLQNLRGVQAAYQKLAVHYGWALARVFSGQTYQEDVSYFDDEWPLPERIVILEEDIQVAPDFFDYFAGMSELLDTDPSLLAVSAFNDNGYKSKVMNETRAVRSDFFPGLGWMMTRRLWQEELQDKWPEAYWDDWLRDPPQRKGRHVIRPEISRTFHFGSKGGASLNQFGDRLSGVQLNSKPVDWRSLDVMRLEKFAFNEMYLDLVTKAQVASDLKDALNRVKEADTRLEYKDFPEFQQLAKSLNLMADEKAGVPRTAYKGIVETRPYGDHLLFLTKPIQETKGEFELDTGLV